MLLPLLSLLHQQELTPPYQTLYQTEEGTLARKGNELFRLAPGTNNILNTLQIPLGGGGDNFKSVYASPNGGAFAVSVTSVGMSVEVTRTTVYSPGFQALPINVAYIYDLDHQTILGAPDIGRHRDQRHSRQGPLTLFDTKTPRMIWRRSDIGRPPYKVEPFPNHLIVRFPSLRDGYQVLDRATGATLYSDPPTSVTVGNVTFNPWRSPQILRSLENHRLFNAMVNLYYVEHNKQAEIWKAPTHRLTVRAKEGSSTYSLIQQLTDRASSSTIDLPIWFKGTVPVLTVNDPDSNLFAFIFASNYHMDGQIESIVFRPPNPPVQLPDIKLVQLTPKEAYGIQQQGGQSKIVKVEPDTQKILWESQSLSKPHVEIYGNHAYVSSQDHESPKITIAIDLNNGKTLWERKDLDRAFVWLMTPDAVIMRENIRPDPNSADTPPDKLYVLDPATGKTIGTYPLNPAPVPPQYQN